MLRVVRTYIVGYNVATFVYNDVEIPDVYNKATRVLEEPPAYGGFRATVECDESDHQNAREILPLFVDDQRGNELEICLEYMNQNNSKIEKQRVKC